MHVSLDFFLRSCSECVQGFPHDSFVTHAISELQHLPWGESRTFRLEQTERGGAVENLHVWLTGKDCSAVVYRLQKKVLEDCFEPEYRKLEVEAKSDDKNGIIPKGVGNGKANKCLCA